MKRDMSKIAKLSNIWIALSKLTDKTHVEFLAFIEKRKDNPFYMLEWGDSLFELAAKHQFYGKLAAIFENIATRLAKGEETKARTEWTQDDIKELVIREFRYIQAVSRSTNQSHNLVNAHLCDIVRKFVFGDSHWEDRWFYDAQREDHEYLAWYKEDCERHQAEHAAKKEAEALAQQAKDAAVRDARRRVKRTLKDGLTPSDMDLLTGYPNGARDADIAQLVDAAKARAKAEREALNI